MKLSIIIINYNTSDWIKKVFGAVQESEPDLVKEFVVVDNGEEKVDPDFLKSEKIIYFDNQKNIGFAGGVNKGLEMAKGEYVLLLNSDVIVKKGSLSGLVDFLDNHKEVGVVGPKFLYPSGKSQISAGRIPNLIREVFRFSGLYKFLPFGTYIANFSQNRSVDWVSGGCLLVRRDLIIKVGGMDSEYFFGAEDMDLCLRIKKLGFKIFYLPSIEIVHYHGISSGGVKSLKRIKLEKTALNYFFKKNFPKAFLTRRLVNFLHDIKYFFIKNL